MKTSNTRNESMITTLITMLSVKVTRGPESRVEGERSERYVLDLVVFEP